jgi:hypothetical protein
MSRYRKGDVIVRLQFVEISDLPEDEDGYYGIFDAYENDADAVTETYLNRGLILTPQVAEALRLAGFEVPS